MRKLVVLAGVVLMMLIGCQDVTIGFLNIENASYDPDTIFSEERSGYSRNKREESGLGFLDCFR